MKKKVLLTMVVLALVVATVCSFVACNKDNGEMAVKEVKSQLDALMEVKALTSDAAIIDATMAGYLLKSDGSFKDLQMVTLDGVEFEKEYYGVAAKKGNDKLIAFVNAGMKKAQTNGKYDELLKKYGLEDRTNKITEDFTVPEDWKSNLADEKEVVIGYTVNAPMGIKDGDTVTGFDIELANAVFEGTGVKVVPKLMDWDQKETLLQSNTIDLVWNGLTVTPEREEAMCISAYYMFNAQAIVINKKDAANFKTKEDLKGMSVVVEAGSAGAENAELIKASLAK